MVVHDANEYLKSDPFHGVGVQSSFPAFALMMNSYYSGKGIKRVEYERNLKWVIKELEGEEPLSPANHWQKP
jgi:hypothetical protein|tara:strand:+ start:552 stop:767 length:216 start_codon:yes stop_codon:yes gene_type:complete